VVNLTGFYTLQSDTSLKLPTGQFINARISLAPVLGQDLNGMRLQKMEDCQVLFEMQPHDFLQRI